MVCKALQCLPEAGGLYDQEANLVQGMVWVLEAVNEKANRELENASRH